MTQARQNQQGFAATVISVVIIAILSLIAVSFSLLMRREQRQALDRQLSTQAFYAAESGINDAINAIESGTLTTDISDCSQTSQITPPGMTAVLDGSGGVVEYTCVLVNRTPGTLEYSDLNTNSSKIVRLEATNGQPISSIGISWQDSGYNAGTGAHTAFAANNRYFLPQREYIETNPTAFPAGGGSILRTTIMPVRAGANRDMLINDAQTLFLYPTGSNANGQTGQQLYQTGDSDGNGTFVGGQCNPSNTPQHCNVNISGLGNDKYVIYLRLKPIYNSANVTITAYDFSGQPLQLLGEQALIDATGRANDVLRRVQVRVPLRTSYFIPEFSIESLGTWCKRFVTYPGGADPVPLPQYLGGGIPEECRID